MREVGQGAAVGRAARLELLLRDQQRGDDAGGDQEDAHDERGRGEQLPGAADAAGRALLGVRRHRPVTCGITATPVSKPDRPSASFGKTRRAIPTMMAGLPCCAVSAAHQSVTRLGMLGDVRHGDRDHDDVEHQVDPDQHDRDADGFLEAAQENRAEQGEQEAA